MTAQPAPDPAAPPSLLETVESPADLRPLSPEALVRLAAEIRTLLIETVRRTGGHLASNLGVVELTIALHRVFDFSQDFLVFDVGHQAYVHKILTGRRAAFASLRQKGGLSGFPHPHESSYDPFVVGHACTGISSALGLAMASRLRGENRTAVAVIGDGSIGGGMAFEALNHAGHSRENILVVLNDNEMAIAETVGALSGYLSRIRTEPGYHRVRDELKAVLQRVPLIGSQLDWLVESALEGLKQVIEPGHIFTELGFSYYGPTDGHDLPLLLQEIENLRRLPGPRLLHVVTKKGNGFDAACSDPEAYHSAPPFEILPCGSVAPNGGEGPTYTGAFADALLRACERDDRIVAITAAMPAGTGLCAIADRFPNRYVDVGISEEHAVTLAAGLARGGMKPAVVIYSTFLQRGYDQIFHDICLQPDLPVVFALDRAGLVGSDGPTHHGVFDIPFLRHLPNMTLLAPRDGTELAAMLDFALGLGRPVAIRYPRSALPESAGGPPARIELGHSETLRTGPDGGLLAYGASVAPALQAAETLAQEGCNLTVVNLRFAKPLDGDRIAELARSLPFLATVEEGALAGGVGGAVLELLQERGIETGRLLRFGVPDRFIAHASRAELLHELGLDAAGLTRRLREARA